MKLEEGDDSQREQAHVYQVFHNSSLGLRVKGKAGISDMHAVRTAEKKSMMRIQSVFEVSRLLGGHG